MPPSRRASTVLTPLVHRYVVPSVPAATESDRRQEHEPVRPLPRFCVAAFSLNPLQGPLPKRRVSHRLVLDGR